MAHRSTLGVLVLLVSASAIAFVSMDERSAGLMLNTLKLAIATCAVSMPLGTLLAWLLVRTDLPGRKGCLVLFGVMPLVPLYLHVAGWEAGFGIQGWHTLAWAGPPLLEGWRGALWVHALAALPWVVLIVGLGLRWTEPELEEQALLDASSWRVFLHVTAPRALGPIGAATLWVAILTAGEITVTDRFMVRTYAEEVYTFFALGLEPGEYLPGLGAGLLLLAWLAAAALVLVGEVSPHVRLRTARPPRNHRLHGWRVPAALMVGTVLLLLAGVPLANLAYKAGVVVTQTDAGRLRTWSAAKCLTVVAESPLRYRREFGWSLAIGLVSATAAVVVAAAAAWWSRRDGLRGAAVLLLSAVGLAVPGPLLGLGLIALLNQPGWPILADLYDQPLFAPCTALAIRGFAPATVILWHAFRTVPPEILDAATVDGAGPLARFRLIVLPWRLPAVGLAWMVVFTLAIGDLAATILVVPPGVTTLSIRIFDLLHSGVEDQVAGICLAMVIVVACLAAGALWLARRAARAFNTM